MKQYIYMLTHMCILMTNSRTHTDMHDGGGVDCCGIGLYQCGGWMLSTTHLI